MRKKLSLILLSTIIVLTTSLTSCVSNDGKDDSKNSIVEGTFGSFKNIDTENSYLGYGINIIDASAINSKNLKMEHPIFSPDKLAKEPLKKVKDHDSVFEYIESDTMEGFCDKMSNSMSLSSGKSASAKGKVEGMDIGASFSFSNGLKTGFKRTEEGVASQYFLRMISENRSYWLILQSDESNYKNLLNEEFEKELYSSEPADLFKKYGTHLLISVAMGGYIHMDYSMYSSSSKIEKESYTEVSNKFKELAEAGFGKEGASSESENSYDNAFSSSNVKEKYGINVEKNIYIAGGKFTGIKSEASFFENYSDWQQSLDTEPVLMGIRDEESLYPIWKLIDTDDERNNNVYEWIDENGKTKTGTRKEQLEAYFVKYGLEQYNQLCEEYRIDYIPISDVEDLEKIAENPSGTFKLMNDINCEGKALTPIKEFSGKLDGANHKIYNFKIEALGGKGAASIGFIGVNTSNGRIINLTIGDEKCTEQSKYSVYYAVEYAETSTEKTQALHVGGIVGKNQGLISNCRVVNIFINTTMADKNNDANAELYLGGIAGRNDKVGNIINCGVYNSKIEGYMPSLADSSDNNLGYLGGICGLNYNYVTNSLVLNSELKLNVVGDGLIINKAYPSSVLGGIVAHNETPSAITNCLTSGNEMYVKVSTGKDTSPTLKCGTIIGFHAKGTYVNCYAQEEQSIEKVVSSTVTTQALVGTGDKDGCQNYTIEADLPEELKKLLP